MNAKTTAAFEEIKKLLEAASTDPEVPVEEYGELVNATLEHCADTLDELEEDDGEEDEEDDEEDDEEEELVDEAVTTDINDEGKTGGS